MQPRERERVFIARIATAKPDIARFVEYVLQCIYFIKAKKYFSASKAQKMKTVKNSNQLTLEQLKKLEYKSLFTNRALIVHVAVQLRTGYLPFGFSTNRFIFLQ